MVLVSSAAKEVSRKSPHAPSELHVRAPVPASVHSVAGGCTRTGARGAKGLALGGWECIEVEQ
jgi:hypothetical protein